MAHRKLQQEVDKVFKKINEGLDVFDMYYERHENCTNNPSQKDKLESDLKREVKKLQRLREQVKSWQSSPDIKDKDALLEYRRRVEIAMEKYKAVEKASKEKAYSNISLKKTDTLDPEERERLETENFLSSMIDDLERQYEAHQVDIDQLTVLNKKKKTHSQSNEDRIKKCKSWQLRYRWHQQQMELALRLLANEELDPKQVNEIKDDISFFVDSNQDDDFVEDESIYDNLDLLSNEAIAHEVAQYFASQMLDDNMANAESTAALSSDATTEDGSKISKKELRKLERDAKKAAKTAAKNAAADSASQGGTVTVKLGSAPLSPAASKTKTESQSTSPVLKAPSASITVKQTAGTSSSSPSPVQPSKTKGKSTAESTTSSEHQGIVHTHIHQGQNGVTGSSILKPATIPARPTGDVKWAVAASQSLQREKEKHKSLSKNSTTSSTPVTSAAMNTTSDTAISTPSVASPVVSDTKLESASPRHPGDTQNGSVNNSSAVTAAAVLAAGAAAVNQNNQQFHRSYTPTLAESMVKVSVDVQQQTAMADHTSGIFADAETTLAEDSHTLPESEEQEDGEVEVEEQENLFLHEDDDLIPNEPVATELSPEQEQKNFMLRSELESDFMADFELLSLPNGINEFIMGYEINNNGLYANDGKLGGYRHSIDLCRIDRLNPVPAGVNPPNPLDAFRSTQQWDVIRGGPERQLDQIIDKFRGLEMFSLFYNYYFAILPMEKQIAFQLLKEKSWKVGVGETMWFLRQGEVKLQNEQFELADYKIFKLDDWSVVDKINFRLDYSNLKYPEASGISAVSSDARVLAHDSAVNDRVGLSHGQQLLQQLKQGKMGLTA
ncbi:CCR4-NOT core subunit NOT3 KNAG_0D01800 [Huiozyma naganishii CBS 8797]|uniref:CCR4-Not complex component Not N-terminal domain-containing protein n=1 Tax=Huiozyma naganishii (strain ATCC MYA-139 / BCRC 22969 / CBS 8797 / KCTC 17520 / NBRC 10181 / NCYC 3082 / Yp74L-3) TaxID=1071383 RepID=J7S6S7_HUIN7|nr:hypothetical protein KNAG_0D01800 [Kazachstania naganishii CBS 8797]CCK69931.1 hypothetical protein KNAG_0D01800 [Kazachstania naganishii CBS 8797]